jgi:uncharacterized protein
MIRPCAMLASLILALSTGPVSAQSNDLKPVSTAAQPTTDVDPALWVVRDADTTIYLFGTIHVLKPGLGWFDEGVKAAFDASDTLVIEMIEPSRAQSAAIMADLSIDKSGRSIRQKLGKTDLPEYEAAVAKLGLSHAQLDPLDAWAVAINLYYAGLFQNGYDPMSGVEVQLKAAASAREMRVVGLETMRGQLSIFDTLPADLQLRYVTDTASSLDEIAPQTDQLVALWSTANTEEVGSIINEGFDSLKLTEPLLTRRNANWARWIDARLAKLGTIFMAVGAGHLAGSVSVQNMLAAYGIQAVRIDY